VGVLGYRRVGATPTYVQNLLTIQLNQRKARCRYSAVATSFQGVREQVLNGRALHNNKTV